MSRTAEDLIKVMRSWVGFSEANGKYREIIDIYNAHRPRARNYRVKYLDSWCDATVSAAAIVSQMTDLIGTECGCEKHIEIFKKKGIWTEDGTITPKPGYIILYNWDDATQPNNGYSDHIGVVEKVENGRITVIEGNLHDAVGRRNIPVGWGYIRGYATPRYDAPEKGPRYDAPDEKSRMNALDSIARDVIKGKYGNGAKRKKAIEAMGLSYKEVQKRVNELLKSRP